MINDIKIGKVYDYNGETGYIITDDYNYPFSKKDVSEEINNEEMVTFIPNIVIFGEEKTYVAKFIKKYNLENENINKKIKQITNEIER